MKLLAALTKLQNLHAECLTRFHRYQAAIAQNKSPNVVKQIYDGYAHHCYLYEAQMAIIRQTLRDNNLCEIEIPTVAQFANKGHSLTGESVDEMPKRVADAKEWRSIDGSDRAH